MNRASLLGFSLQLFPALALAQSAPADERGSGAQTVLDPSVDAPPPGVHVVDDAEPTTPLVPRAKDLLGSHLLVGASVGPAWSLGKLGTDQGALSKLGTGLGVDVDAGFGVSRSVVVGAWGTFVGYTNADSAKAFAIGPFVRYHLAQGLRFDPWFTLGGGYRRLSFDDAGALRKFSGVEWLHFELGADYYVFSGLGFGPYGALSLSSFSQRPTAAGDAAVNAELSAGLRFLFDLPGR